MDLLKLDDDDEWKGGFEAVWSKYAGVFEDE